MIPVSIVPIVAAGVVSALVGWVWYHPRVFGSALKRLSGVIDDPTARPKNIFASILVALLAGMLIAWVMTFIGNALYEFFDWVGAVELAFWIWLGFIVPTLLAAVLWEGRSFKIFLIQAFHWLITFILIALVLLYGGLYFSGQASLYGQSDSQLQVAD